MAQNQLLFIGTHEDSAVDQQLAEVLMGRISTKLKGNVAIGLEQASALSQASGWGRRARKAGWPGGSLPQSRSRRKSRRVQPPAQRTDSLVVSIVKPCT